MTQAGSRSAAPMEMADPRDPRGLRSDAPLLDAWLRFTAQAEAGLLTPDGASPATSSGRT